MPVCGRQGSTLGQASPAPMTGLFLFAAPALGHYRPIQTRTDFWDGAKLWDHGLAHLPGRRVDVLLSQILGGQTLHSRRPRADKVWALCVPFPILLGP